MKHKWSAIGIATLVLAAAACKEGAPDPDGPAAVKASVREWSTKEWTMARGGPQLQGRVHDPVPREPKVVWSVETEGDVIGPAAVADGVVYVGTVMGFLHALDAASGEEIWKVEFDDTVEASPAVFGGTVFVGSNDGMFHALDAKTGEERWSIEGNDKFPSGAVVLKSLDGTEDWVLVNGYDGTTRCLRAKDGSVVWEYQTDNYINGAPGIVDGKYTVFGGCDALIHTVGLADGKVVNSVETEAYIIDSVAIHGTTIYASNYANQVVASEVTGAQLKWVYSDGDFAFETAPAVNDVAVFFGSRDKHLHAIDRATGAGLWKFKTGARVDSSPIVFDDAVVFGSNDGRLYAVETETGEEVWKIDLGEELTAAPVFANGLIFVGGGDGTMFAVGEGG